MTLQLWVPFGSVMGVTVIQVPLVALYPQSIGVSVDVAVGDAVGLVVKN